MIDIPFHMPPVNPYVIDVVLTVDLQHQISSFLNDLKDYHQSNIQQLPKADLCLKKRFMCTQIKKTVIHRKTETQRETLRHRHTVA